MMLEVFVEIRDCQISDVEGIIACKKCWKMK